MVLTPAMKALGAAVAAAVVGAVGVLASGRGEHKDAPLLVAQPTVSAPALTTADLVGVRDEVRQLRLDTTKDIATVRDDVRELRKEMREARRGP
jgi:hypothetical protein